MFRVQVRLEEAEVALGLWQGLGLLQHQGLAGGFQGFLQSLHLPGSAGPLGSLGLLHGKGGGDGGDVLLLDLVVGQGHFPGGHPDADAAPGGAWRPGV